MKKSTLGPYWALLFSIICGLLAFAKISLENHHFTSDGYHTFNFIRNFSNGIFFYEGLTFDNYFSIHSYFALLSLIPILWLHSDPFILLIVAIAQYAIASYLISNLSKKTLPKIYITIIFLNPVLLQMVLGYEEYLFQPDILVILPASLIIYSLVRKKENLFLISILFLLSIKEELFIYFPLFAFLAFFAMKIELKKLIIYTLIFITLFGISLGSKEYFLSQSNALFKGIEKSPYDIIQAIIQGILDRNYFAFLWEFSSIHGIYLLIITLLGLFFKEIPKYTIFAALLIYIIRSSLTFAIQAFPLWKIYWGNTFPLTMYLLIIIFQLSIIFKVRKKSLGLILFLLVFVSIFFTEIDYWDLGYFNKRLSLYPVNKFELEIVYNYSQENKISGIDIVTISHWQRFLAKSYSISDIYWYCTDFQNIPIEKVSMFHLPNNLFESESYSSCLIHIDKNYQLVESLPLTESILYRNKL